jgi:hypothetical protein
MSTIEHSVEVRVPLSTAYNQWMRVKGELQRFKEMIESRGRESGAWRGQVDRPDER